MGILIFKRSSFKGGRFSLKTAQKQALLMVTWSFASVNVTEKLPFVGYQWPFASVDVKEKLPFVVINVIFISKYPKYKHNQAVL